MAIISPHRAVLALVIFLVAAPAALADPPGGYTASCCNAPDSRDFLSSAPRSYWGQFDQPPVRMAKKRRPQNRQWLGL